MHKTNLTNEIKSKKMTMEQMKKGKRMNKPAQYNETILRRKKRDYVKEEKYEEENS